MGKTLEVIIEGEHPDTELLIKSRHRGQAPDIDGNVLINDLGRKKINIGDLHRVEISEVIDYDLVGKVL